MQSHLFPGSKKNADDSGEITDSGTGMSASRKLHRCGNFLIPDYNPECCRRVGKHSQHRRGCQDQLHPHHREVEPGCGEVEEGDLHLRGAARLQIHDGQAHCGWLVSGNIE